EQLLDPELIRPDPLDRADGTLQHVVSTPELVGLFDGDDVLRLLDNADHMKVPAVVSADPAQIALSHVETSPAEDDLVLHLDDRPSQAQRIFLRQLEEVKRHP